jgi:hypothetical protein
MNIRLSNKDWQLLSEYLDGQLSQRERDRLEHRLETQADLKQALDDLQRMRAVLRGVPRRKVPHNFTLTASMVQKPNPFARWVPALSLSSALATLILVVTIVFRTSPFATPDTLMTAEEAAPEASMMMEAPEAESAAEADAPIILWGGPENYASVPAEGRGGGGGGGGGADLPPSVLIEPELGIQVAPETPKDFPPAEDSGPALEEGELPASEGTPQPTEAAAGRVEAPPVEGAGPILGVAPQAQQGQVQDVQPAPAELAEAQALQEDRVFPWLTVLQITLAAIAIAAGAAALVFYLRSRSRA